MFLNWFDAEEAKKIGQELADDVIAELVLVEKKGKSQRVELKSKAKVLNKLFIKVSQYNVQSKLNLYKKAQFANSFKWRLQEAGCDAEFIEILTKELLLNMK